jgi:hypothetical protein
LEVEVEGEVEGKNENEDEVGKVEEDNSMMLVDVLYI